MYPASPFSARAQASPRPAGLYARIGVETRVAAATPHELVSLLFEGCMEALAQAQGALREGRRADKGLAIGRAVRIVEEGLRAGLDIPSGGPLARDLDELYRYLTRQLTLANLRDDASALDECRRLLLPLQEAWAAIGPGRAMATGARP
jgi:flagellar secretion chaperone FliS